MLLTTPAYTLRQWKHWTFKIESIEFQMVISKPLCTSVSFDSNASCYSELSLPKTNEWTFTAGAKLYFPSGARYWTNFYWKNRCLRLQLTSLLLLEQTSKLDSVSLQQTFNRIPLQKYLYRASFPFDFAPVPDNDTFAIINTQPSIMQGEHWILTGKFCNKLYFAD